MLSFLRPAAVMLALSAPVQAQSLSAIAEAEHRIWRDRIVGLFTELEGIPDDAPMASAQRLHLLAQVRFWTTAIAEWPPGMAKPSPVREMLAVDPARAVPALAVPLEEQVAREVDRVHEAKDACLDDPTATCLLDAAAGYAAASKSMQGAAVVHLRLARVAQMTNDPARLGLLRRMAVEEVPLYERKQDLDGERVESGLVTRANLFRRAGFEAEAHQLARQVAAKWRIMPGDPYTTITNLLLDEYAWRSGETTAAKIAEEAEYFIAAEDPKYEALSRMVPALLLTVMATVEEAPAFEARALRRIQGLPAANAAQEALDLAVTLGWVGRADLVAQFPASRVDEMLRLPEKANAAQIGQRMLAALFAGQDEVARDYREQLLDLMTRLPDPAADPSKDQLGIMAVTLAHLAEVQARIDG